jgi:regulator of nucleoside diphosphate kinase
MHWFPEITITTADRRRLVSLATAALADRRDGVAASMLLSKIAEAAVVTPDLLPSTVVAMESEVEVRDNIKETTEHLRIVFPSDADSGGKTISVLTSVGAALFGLSEGASIEWCTTAKDRKNLTVLRVWQPKPIKMSSKEGAASSIARPQRLRQGAASTNDI